MFDLPDLKGRVRIDTSDLDAAVGKAAKSGSLIGSALGTVAGGAISGGLGLAADAVKSLTFDSITAASDLGETANKISTIFGSGADALNAFADTADTKLGQSKQSALDAAATFGVFGKAAGLSGPKLAGFSSGLVTLSSDLASFHNAKPEEVVEALGAALRGEAEPMQRFGVLLDDASMRQEALRQGLVKTTKDALTPQQKVLAAQGLILKQTAVAQGDFSKTSDGMANRQRIAAAQFQNLQTKLGQGLLPVVNTILGAFVKFIPVMTTVAGAIGNTVGPAIARIGAVVASVFSGQGGLGGAVSGLGPVIAQVAAAFGRFLPIVAQVGGQILATVVPVLKDLFRIIVTQIVPAVSGLISAFLPVAGVIMRAVGPVIQALVVTLGGVVRTIFTQIANVIKLVTAIFKGDWSGAWQAMQDILRTALDGLLGFLRNVFTQFIPAIIRGAGGLIVRLWNASLGKLVSAAGEKIAQVHQFFVDLPGNILSALGNLGSMLLSAGGDLIGGLIEGIKSRAGEIIDTLRTYVTNLIPDWVKNALGISSPSKVMAELGRFTAQGMAVGLAGERDAVSTAAQSVADAAVRGFGTPTLAMPRITSGGATASPAAALVQLSPESLAALADRLAPGITQILLDGRVLAEAVDRRIGADAGNFMRGATP